MNVLNSNSDIKKEFLFIFDLDHTILKENSDRVILPLLSDQSCEELKPLSDKSDNWANFMQEVYVKMKRDGRNVNEIKDIIEKMEFNPGFEELFNFIRENKSKFDTLIVSGANTLFLEWILEKKGLKDLFPIYYSNVADPDDSVVIKIRPYHTHDCENCDLSQCKRLILCEHWKNKNIDLNDYKTIMYAGDGENDFCPGTILREGDLFFPRANFPLAKKLYNKGHIKDVKCSVHVWENGFNIIDVIKKLL
jgi:2,3-diketo-5-methylthio-1-phosphopentane phosphatase